MCAWRSVAWQRSDQVQYYIPDHLKFGSAYHMTSIVNQRRHSVGKLGGRKPYLGPNVSFTGIKITQTKLRRILCHICVVCVVYIIKYIGRILSFVKFAFSYRLILSEDECLQLLTISIHRQYISLILSYRLGWWPSIETTYCYVQNVCWGFIKMTLKKTGAVRCCVKNTEL